MTPIEAAVKAYDHTMLGTSENHVRAIITAFLEAAAEDEDVLFRVADVAVREHLTGGSYWKAGKAAILALKEAVGS